MRAVPHLLWRLTLLCAVLSLSCTDPIQRSLVTVEIDADPEVRPRIPDVTALVEVQAASDEGFTTRTMKHFMPNATNTWPLRFRVQLQESDYGGLFQLTATGRTITGTEGTQGTVLAQARVISSLRRGDNLEFRAVFESSCFRRTELCLYGQTCSRGQCVAADKDPYGAPGEPRPNAPSNSPDAGDVIDPSGAGVVSGGEGCGKDGDRGCAGHATRTPLLCEGGAWREQTPCAESERCDTADGPMRGQCRPIAPECRNQTAEVAFCDAEEITRVCTDLVSSRVSPCSDNERCVMSGGVATCDCKPGFSNDGSGCREATSCDVDRGGCDPLTTCTPMGNSRVCGPCPDDYTGDGQKGCSPLLTSLVPSAGTLEPAFSRAVFDYRLRIPMVVQRVRFDAAAPGSAQIALNGSPITERIESPILPLGETMLELVVSSERGVPTRYRVTVDRSGEQHAYLKASRSGAVDHFGYSLAMSGDTLVAGAFYEDSNATGIDGDAADNSSKDSGAAYVFVRQGDRWVQQAYLKASDTRPDSFFGNSVAIDGDTIAVGALEDDIYNPATTPDRPGAVYVFVRSGSTWSQQAKLMVTDGKPGDMFGYSVDVDGDTLVAGAGYGDGTVVNSGSAYVFTRSGSTWTERQRLLSSMPSSNANFGSEVEIDGDAIAVAAQEESVSVTRGGAVYVFERNGSGWGTPLRLQPKAAIRDATFGFGLALHGKLLAVGAPRAEFVPTMTRPAGEVYVFERGASGWAEAAVLTSSHPADGDYFGFSVDFSDSALLVGAPGEAGTGRGFRADPTQFGSNYSGAIYLFARNDESWTLNDYVKASNADRGDGFGYDVAIDERWAAVSAIWEASDASGIDGNQASNAASNAGAVYTFE